MDIDKSKIITDVSAKIIEDSVKGAWEKVKKFFKDNKSKDEIDYRIAYETYLINTKNKYSKIKTLIYRHAPKDIYSFYECTGVLYGDCIIDTSNINNLICVNTKILITGTGGIGKSMLFKHIFLNAMEKTCFVPVFIELRSFNSLDKKDINIRTAIYDVLSKNGFNLEDEYYEYSLSRGGYIILLDGFDEVNRDIVSKVTSEIRGFSDKYNKNTFIVSSRPSDYFIGWNDFVEMSAMELTKDQALELIDKIEFDESVKTIFYNELKNNLYEKYKSFASNPLLLNIMLLTFNNHASIPDRLNDFYDQAFSTLFNMHDATKEAYVRDIRTGLSCEEFKELFAYICFKSYFKDEFVFSETKLRDYIIQSKEKINHSNFSVDDFLLDLSMSVCMIMKDGLEYRYVHRSFQEYFAAWYTCKLTDDVQKILLNQWIKNSNNVTGDKYFSMLFNMQSDKVNKIILCPEIKKIKKIYDSCGFTIDFIKKIYDRIMLEKSVFIEDLGEKSGEYTLLYRVKNKYFDRIIFCTCEFNNFSYKHTNDEINTKVVNKLLEINNDDFEELDFSLDDAVEILGEKELLRNFEFLKSRLHFVFDILQKYDSKSISEKTTIDSIIDGI